MVEHHKTKAKRLKVEAEARGEVIEETLESQVAPVKPVLGRPWRVFDSRANLIAQVNTLDEADEALAKLPGGFKSMI